MTNQGQQDFCRYCKYLKLCCESYTNPIFQKSLNTTTLAINESVQPKLYCNKAVKKRKLFIKYLAHHSVKLVKHTSQVSVLIQTQLLLRFCCSQSCGLFTGPLEYLQKSYWIEWGDEATLTTEFSVTSRYEVISQMSADLTPIGGCQVRATVIAGTVGLTKLKCGLGKPV